LHSLKQVAVVFCLQDSSQTTTPQPTHKLAVLSMKDLVINKELALVLTQGCKMGDISYQTHATHNTPVQFIL